ncbi:MAG: MATE family efflux transporter [Lachnospiraceae bacterium]|nr:MATE family efflux transporter [Lachnospiraceae bacterium]
MLNGPLAGPIILFALPLALSSMLQQLFNAADTAVVGRFASSQAMAAVGSNSSVINLVVALFVGLSVGTNVVIASLIGRGRKEEIPTAVHTAVVVALISGVLLFFVGIGIARPMLTLMNTPEDVLDLAVLYLRIYFLGMPFIMLYNFGAAILRSKGDSTRPVYALICGGVLNVLLNLLLVIVFHLHVIGVASATVTSNVVSSFLVMWFLLHEEDEFRLNPKNLQIHRGYLMQMIRIGLPAGLQGVVFSLSNTVIQSGVNSFGSSASAGSAAALNFEIIAYYIVNSFNQATVTFTSQNYAAGKYDRVKKVFRLAILFTVIGAGTLDFLFIAGRHFTLSLFTTDPEVFKYAVIRFTHILAFQWMVSSYEISGSAMRGMGYSMTPTVITIFGTCVFRIFWVLTLFPRHRDFGFLLYVYPASWLITGSLVLLAYFLVCRKAMPARALERGVRQ